MSDFREYGQHYPDRDFVHEDLRKGGDSALVFDRENKIYEAWVDGRMISRGSNQIQVNNSFHAHREVSERLGESAAHVVFPDLAGQRPDYSASQQDAYRDQRERDAEHASKELEKLLRRSPFGR